MARAFLVVMDSVGIGGAPDADQFFNGDLPDTGANTVAHIAQGCAEGRGEEGRSGPLALPHLDALGLGAATNGDTGFENPYSMVMHGGRLFVADLNNARVKGFNSVPSSTAPSYDFILGASDSGGTTSSRLNAPRGLASNGSDKLYVSESNNHRISIYKDIDGSNTPLIDSVIGQINFTTGNPNDSGSSIGFYEPGDIRYHQGRLIIADVRNGRVLIIPAP